MSYKKLTIEEEKQKKHERYKIYYEANKEHLNKYRRGKITREEYFKLRKLNPSIAKKVVNCIDCNNKIESKTERCISCQRKHDTIEHLKRNPIAIKNPGPCNILVDLWEGKQVNY